MLLDPLGGALSRAQIPPSSRKEKGSGVTSQNPWASYRSMEWPIRLQSGHLLE